MRFDILTLFPEIFTGYLRQSLLKLAIDRGLVEIHLWNIRDWAQGKHKQVDDRPFGGGPGMVLKVEPVVECVEAVQASAPAPGHVVMLTPQGARLDQRRVEGLATRGRLVLLCGRYEGFDERVRQILDPEEISLGDFVLNGGEVAAMALVDTVIRLVPNVLGDEESSRQDSFSSSNRLLEFAQYTRPREYRGHAVPDVLLSGDHPRIADWRKAETAARTLARRSDLLSDSTNQGSAPPDADGIDPG